MDRPPNAVLQEHIFGMDHLGQSFQPLGNDIQLCPGFEQDLLPGKPIVSPQWQCLKETHVGDGSENSKSLEEQDQGGQVGGCQGETLKAPPSVSLGRSPMGDQPGIPGRSPWKDTGTGVILYSCMQTRNVWCGLFDCHSLPELELHPLAGQPRTASAQFSK